MGFLEHNTELGPRRFDTADILRETIVSKIPKWS